MEAWAGSVGRKGEVFWIAHERAPANPIRALLHGDGRGILGGAMTEKIGHWGGEVHVINENHNRRLVPSSEKIIGKVSEDENLPDASN